MDNGSGGSGSGSGGCIFGEALWDKYGSLAQEIPQQLKVSE